MYNKNHSLADEGVLQKRQPIPSGNQTEIYIPNNPPSPIDPIVTIETKKDYTPYYIGAGVLAAVVGIIYFMK